MTGGLDYERAVKIAKDHEKLQIGVHLNITWGKPNQKFDSVSTLINTDRSFLNLKDFIIKYLSKKISLNEIFLEFRSQIESVIENSIYPSHLDSHQHIHLFPGIYKIVKKLSLDYNIPWVRKPFEPVNSSFHNFTKRTILSLLTLYNAPLSYKNNNFRGLGIQENSNYLDQLLNIIKNLPSGKTELMVHPAEKDDVLKNIDPFVESRFTELNSLCNPEVINEINSQNIVLDK